MTTRYGNESWPDIQIAFIATHPGFDGGTLYKNFLKINSKVFDEYFIKNAFAEGFTMYPILSRPKSRGRLSLRSSDPNDHPVIEPNYLTDPSDVKVLIEGKHCGKIPKNSEKFQFLDTYFQASNL